MPVKKMDSKTADILLGETTPARDTEIFRVTVIESLNNLLDSIDDSRAADATTVSDDELADNIAWARRAAREYPTVPTLPEIQYPTLPNWDEV